MEILLFTFLANSGGHPVAAAHPQSATVETHCRVVGGTMMTNFGAIDQNTTMGTATGDLRGAVSGTILGAPQPGTGSTLVFHVQHHWVTETGETLFFDPATATTVPLSQTLFAIVTYPVHLKGGTGRFAGATGDLRCIAKRLAFLPVTSYGKIEGKRPPAASVISYIASGRTSAKR